MVKRCMLFIALTAVFANTASAQLNNPTRRARLWDFTIQTRYAGDQTFEGTNLSEARIESDLGWGMGFGYNVNERVNVGFAFTWRSTPYTATVVADVDPREAQDYSSWLDASTVALGADFNLLPKRFTPYVSGGIGWTFIDSNIPADLYQGCWWHPWYGYMCGTAVSTYGTDEFSYSIGVGLRLELSEMFFVRVGYDYNGVNIDGADGLDIFRLDAGFTLR